VIQAGDSRTNPVDTSGYAGDMSENSTEDSAEKSSDETRQDERGERETPEVGLIADEDLPEDLQPTDDNPLAQDPSETDDSQEGDSSDSGPGPSGEKKVEGMPDMGEPS
jgi:hypothetical protein